MAQIIKHRRGSIGALKDVTANVGELVMATGSIGDLNAPVLFIGSDAIAGGYKPVSKVYQGATAPTLGASYGSTMDGTPFYSNDSKTLYILDHNGNIDMDLTGNIEGNTISGVTINNLQSTNVTASYVSASFVGDGGGLYGIPATGITGLNLSKIYSGSVQVTTDSVSGDININADNGVYVSGTTFNVNGNSNFTGSVNVTGDTSVSGSFHVLGANVHLTGSETVELTYDGQAGFISDITKTEVFSYHSDLTLISYNNNVNISTDGNPTGTINLHNNTNLTGSFNVSGNTSITGALVVADGSATFDQGLVAQNSNMLLTSGSNLIVQDGGNAQVDYLRGNTQEWNYLALNSNGVYSPSGVELASSGNISLWAEGGTVNVTGSLRVTGDIVFSGSINLGDYTGDTVNFNGEISSSIIPQVNNAFSLGASGQTWSDVWAENAHFTNISLNSIAFDGLTEGRVVAVGLSGSLVDYSGFTFDGTNLNVSGAIEVTNIQGTGSLYLKPDKTDSRLFEIYNTGSGDVHIKGNSDYSYFGDDTNYLLLDHLNNDVKVNASDVLRLFSQNDHVYLESFGGTVYINDDNGNDTRIGGNTYINDNLYVNRIYDDNNNNNYLQLYGWNTDDGYWWESGNGADTTLLNNENNNNLNILQTNNGNVNIDATNGSVNLHSANGFNVTGSMIVSDGSGVFNSSLIVSNSDLTLDGGSNIQMNDGAHLYFNNGCGDIYYNTGNDELTLYNDCGNIRLSNNTYTSNNMYFDDGNRLYTNYISDYNGNDLNINTDGGIYIYSDSTREIQLSTNNAESGTNYINVNNDNVYFSTYDFTSGLTHKVLLDNTGSLKLENVSLSLTGSLNVSGSLDVQGVTHIHNDLYVSGNLTILGSGSVVHISSSQVDLGTNIINLNTYAPFERFAGISVYDSGSNVGVTGSLLWDSTNNVWIYSNPTGSGYASARFISGPQNTGSLGDETGLTNGHFPIATGDDHISDSLLTYQGTTLALNTNKFTVDSGTGDTYILGNVTIDGAGGSDLGIGTSFVVFRNDDGVLGFVDSTDLHTETTQLMGYEESTGNLIFSSLIDGGLY